MQDEQSKGTAFDRRERCSKVNEETIEGISLMEKQIKTIGVLTSGGDAPGMNAAIRAVVRTGLHKGYRMIGIQRGYNGLLNGECFEMNLRSVSNIIQAGGTILYTARCLEFKTKEGQDKGRGQVPRTWH